MPRACSMAIQSERVRRRSPRARTWPASWMAPPNSSSFSVSVVLPASGWEMMANVRRRAISRWVGSSVVAGEGAISCICPDLGPDLGPCRPGIVNCGPACTLRRPPVPRYWLIFWENRAWHGAIDCCSRTPTRSRWRHLPVARCRSTTATWQTSSARSMPTIPCSTPSVVRAPASAPGSRSRRSRAHGPACAPAGAVMSKSLAESLRRTPHRVAGESPDRDKRGMSASILPPSRQHRAARDDHLDRQASRDREVRMRSARRPGAIEPSSRSRPKCCAVLSVAIWMAVIGFRPWAIAWRTTRSMCPS